MASLRRPPQSKLNLLLISLFLISVTLFFLLFSPSHRHQPHHRRRRLLLIQTPSCSDATNTTAGGGGIINYLSLHSCLLSSNHYLSLPLLSLILLFLFYSLSLTASLHFSPIVTSLSSRLRLSPSSAAVTLLALGNGAPDLFSSSAALRSGHPRTGLAAILSAGAFVSAFVVGAVAVIAAPFPLDPVPFVRDVFFYLLAASGLFYVYLSAEIYLWQAVEFVGFYVFFVGLVFWMDFAGRSTKRKEEVVELGLVEIGDGGAVKKQAPPPAPSPLEIRDIGKELDGESHWWWFRILGKVLLSMQNEYLCQM